MTRKAIALAAVAAALVGGTVAGLGMINDARYEHRCVQHASDIPLCATGYAAEARSVCDNRVPPPAGFELGPGGVASCVRAYLAWEKGR